MSESTIDATAVKYALPRSAGTPRPASRIQPGWWVHLAAEPGQTSDVPDGWEQVDYVIEAAGICVIRFLGDNETEVTVPSRGLVTTLTAAQARRHGLVGES